MNDQKKIKTIPEVAVRRTRESQPCIKKWLRYPIKAFGYGNKYAQAFTLIELLVVVLIIGILAAIAVPQYQKAVEKARVSEALMNLNTLRKAVDVFFLEQGNDQVFPSSLDQLDVQVPAKTKFFAYDVYSRTLYAYRLRANGNFHDYRDSLYYIPFTWDPSTKTWTMDCAHAGGYTLANYICNYLRRDGYTGS